MTMTKVSRGLVVVDGDLGHCPCWPSPIRRDDRRIDGHQDGPWSRSTPTSLF